MKADKLKELRTLREQEKAIKARIDAISDEATQEAVALAPDGGEFEVEGQKYQLQRTEVIDMMNSRRYKGEDAKRWRGRGRQAVAEFGRAAGFCQEDRFGLHQGDGGDRQSLCRYTPRLGTR